MPVKRARPDLDQDALPVLVPRNLRPLVPTAPERLQRLREHLNRIVTAMTGWAGPAPTAGPQGFTGRVAQTACAMCAGSCCRNGADDGFLDETAVARGGSGLSGPAIVQRYVERVPAAGYEGSCIFHGKFGCTLDRSMRSDVCNAHFCGGLHAYLSGGGRPEPTIVLAGEGNKMRISPVLRP